MPSQLKSDTARANGAKSHGPVTPEGQAISSRNSIRHGLTAKAVVLPGESEEEFQELLDSYIDQFQPASAVESELVQSMAVSRWRLNRIAGIETNLFSTEIVIQRDDANEEVQNLKPDDHLAWVFKNLADNGNALSVLLRYEGTLTRTYGRAFKQLDQLQRTRRSVQPNEPIPTTPTPAIPTATIPTATIPSATTPTPTNTTPTNTTPHRDDLRRDDSSRTSRARKGGVPQRPNEPTGPPTQTLLA